MRSAYQKGRDAMNAGLHAEAILHFEQWTKLMPRDPIAYVYLASCQARIGNPQQTIQSLLTSVQTGLEDIHLIETDSILRSVISKNGPLARSLSSIFKEQEDPWLALISHAQAKVKRFPLAFAEQKRIGRYRISLPKGYDSTKQYSFILLLHGNGLDPTFMLNWIELFGFSSHIIIAPEAPYLKFNESRHAGTMKFSGRGEDQSIPDSLDEEVITLTSEWYHSIIDQARTTLPISKDPGIVMGFSQGGFFATVLLSRFPESYSTAITMCGSQYPSGKVVEGLQVVKKYNRDILILHGKQDQIVPYAIAETFAGKVKEHDIPFQFLSFEGGHWPTDDVLDDIKAWVISH
ncbi:MAG: alpha/beta hydrolase-fold protein [Candidatus Kapaibacteriota bacterium]